MNIYTLRSAITGFALLFFSYLSAQCTYRLDLFDKEGDGWENGVLTLVVGSQITTYTLNNSTDDGLDTTIYIQVLPNQVFTLRWTPGLFSDEASVVFYDAENFVLYKNSQMPGTPSPLFGGTTFCPSCYGPADARIENVWDTRARFRWNPGPNNPPTAKWQVIYGPKGFKPGPGQGDTFPTNTPKATLLDLQKVTAYDAYIQTLCDATMVSRLIGPLSFTTYLTNDVGISAVFAPETGCDLGLDTVKIVLSNYGAAPQSLIPFKYTVNGEDAGVGQPDDGFYTDVLGKDSSEALNFETLYDFSKPGEYEIKVFTELKGDEKKSNDTTVYYLTNRIVAPYRQDFEKWNGAWHVDTSGGADLVWQYGVPDKAAIPAAGSGEKSWVTYLDRNVRSGDYTVLESPCFDFSGVTEDPAILFQRIHDSPLNRSGGFLQSSTDDGTTWKKVGAFGSGLNWYNFTNKLDELGDVWSGETNGWIPARNLIPGVAGKKNVRLRYVFQNSRNDSSPGMGIDDIRVSIPWSKDLVGLRVRSKGDTSICGLQQDTVSFSHSNFGKDNQIVYKVAYSINGGAPVVEDISTDTLKPNEFFTYKFKKPFDSRDGIFNVRAWTILTGEQDFENDTARYTIDHKPTDLPYAEKFENGELPKGWATDFGIVDSTHQNTSFVLAHNLYDEEPSFISDAPRVGLVRANDSLWFDYRITNWALDGGGKVPTILSGSTRIEVQVSDNCGESFQTVYTIGAGTHTPSTKMRTIKLGLGAYANKYIIVRFRGTWTSGDFWFDVDNFNIDSKAPVAVVEPDKLLALKLYPNPTSGAATLYARFEEPVETGADLFNLMGQRVWSLNPTRTRELNAAIELDGLPDGLYLLRLTADVQATTRKLVKKSGR
jgi:Secretion system C-terminal sorting domain